MVTEMLTTRRDNEFRRATGCGEEEEVGARHAAGSGEGWLRLRWLQREEDEEGTAGGDCGSKGAAAATTEAQMRCGSRKRRRRYCAPTGKKKELAAAAKQRRQRRQVRSREEGEKQGRGGDRVGVCDRGLQAAVRRRLRQWVAAAAVGDGRDGRR
ncbi:hypothetical protein GW17_00023678 [Ensete ventricosum]|nr:hypothetical protein GW17_00023678 [Ensete ventricosum]